MKMNDVKTKFGASNIPNALAKTSKPFLQKEKNISTIVQTIHAIPYSSLNFPLIINRAI
jgi:hypothetical protein